MKSNNDGVSETSHLRVKIPISSMFDHMFHLPKKWVKCTEKTQISGIIFKRHEIFWPNLYTLFSFMHALPKTHGVYMYCCSRFIASTAEAYAIELNMGRRPSLSTNERS